MIKRKNKIFFAGGTIFMFLGLVLYGTGFAQGFNPDVLGLNGRSGLTIEADPAYDLSRGGTIEFWVQPSWAADPGYDPVVVCSAGPEGAEYVIAVLRDRDGIAVATEDWELPVAVDLTDSNFHHVAVTSLDEGVMVFVDGRHVGSSSAPIKARPAVGLWVGTLDGSASGFSGEIAAMRFWSRPLSQETIAAYATQDLFSSLEPHPDMDALAAISDFTTGDMLITEQ